MKRKNILKPAFLATAIAMFTLYGVSPAKAGLEEELEDAFGGMINVTDPGIHETQRRGVLSGGRITYKTKIYNENVIGFTPPSFKAGCGGIDLYGGSLSFVNSDQIVELLRAVAANAKGYAFQLALDSTCPSCSKWIESFQKQVQALNQFLGNSCQLAQGIVNDGISAITNKENTGASIMATGQALYSDSAQAWTQGTGTSPQEELKARAPDKYKEIIGNVVWVEMKKQNTASWFSNGDNALLEALMTMTGSVIVGDLVADPASPGSDKTNPLQVLPVGTASKVQLSDLVFGGPVKTYSCENDTELCTTAISNPQKEVTLTGAHKLISDMLLGSPSSVGIIQRFATNGQNGGALSEQQKAFMAGLPIGTGTMIRNLAVLSPASAEIFAARAASSIAIMQVKDAADQLMSAVENSLALSKSSYRDQVYQMIRDARRNLDNEYALMRTKYGDVNALIGEYNEIIENTRKQRYYATTVTSPSSKD